MIGNLPETLFLRLGKILHYTQNVHGGFTPVAVAPPMRQIPNRYYVIIASAGAVWGTGTHLHHRTPALYFLSKGKEFSRAVSPSVFYYRGRGNRGIAGAALFADSPPVSGERVVPWKRDHTWRRYPDIKEIHSGLSRGIATRKTGKNFSGYKAKTGIPYTLISEHEAGGIYGPQTLEIPG